MARAIVPAQPPHRLEQRARDIQNAFALFDRRARFIGIVVVLRIQRNALEETRRRKLLRIADDDNLAAARQRADRVLGLELRGLVHHDEIEFQLSGSEILRNRQRPHHEARFERQRARWRNAVSAAGSGCGASAC